MLTRIYDETALRGRLSGLDRSAKTAFAAACAESLVPLQERYWTKTGNSGKAARAREILDSAWDVAFAGNSDVSSLESEAVSLGPTDDEEWSFDMGYAQNAAAALAYAVRTWLSGGAQEAAWAAPPQSHERVLQTWRLRTATGVLGPTEMLEASPAAPLLEETGIGPVTAAVVYTAWSHLGRVRSEAAFAALAGVNPIPASSGNTVRHRLNRGGDRRLNCALHMATVVRTVHDPDTRAYAERRKAEGKTPREIRRCLKRYLARRLYRTLNALHAPDSAVPTTA